MEVTRREFYAPLIAAVLEKNGSENTPELRAALRAAFPHSPLSRWPYKVWRSGIRCQLGLTDRCWPVRVRKQDGAGVYLRRARTGVDSNQLPLFQNPPEIILPETAKPARIIA